MKTSLFLRRIFAIFALFLFFVCTASTQLIVINEVCADNDAGFNNDGDFPDYVELFNTSSSPVNIAGWRLMITNYGELINDPKNLYIFPANTAVPAGGFLVVICDGETNQPLHTRFSIDREGGHLFLLNPAGTQIRDAVRFGFQVTDRPFGRVPDGTNGVHVLCRPTPGTPNVQVPTGIRNLIRINEWMPSAASDPDWFEIYNPATNNPISIAGIVFADTNNPAGFKPVITNSWLGSGAFLRFKCDRKPDTGNDELGFNLSAGGDQIIIFRSATVPTIWHRVFWPDPTGREGQTNDPAPTFVSFGWLPDGNTSDPVVTFTTNRPTPEASNFLPIDNVLINEVLAHTDLPLEDAIELYNPTATNVNIGGWWLSDNKDTYNKFRIPNNTSIPPNGYVVFYEYLGVPGPGFNTNGTGNFPSFALSSSQGDDVYLFATFPGTAKLNGFRRGVDFPASPNGISYGRYITSTGESDFVPLRRPTFGTDMPPSSVEEFRTGTGAPNANPTLGPLVLNEIMYHPPDIIAGTNIFDNELDEYVEIYNISTQTVYLYDRTVYPYPPFGMAHTNTWHLRGEVDFDFPTNVSLGPGRSLLVVNFGLTNIVQLNTFRAKYSVPPGVQIFGAYRGKLSNGGGSVEIERPDAPQPPSRPDAGFVPYLRVDRVRYNDEAPWPVEPDGTRINPGSPNSIGYVLARKRPERYGGDVTNWVAAVPSAGRQLISNSVSRVGGVVTISFEGLAGSGYTVQYRPALEGGIWEKLEDVQPQNTSGPRQVTTTAGPGPKRFYRVVTPIQ